jgi:hypothetical protein
MAHVGILCPTCFKDWVKPWGEVRNDVQWYACPSCGGRKVAFNVDAPTPSVGSLLPAEAPHRELPATAGMKEAAN